MFRPTSLPGNQASAVVSASSLGPLCLQAPLNDSGDLVRVMIGASAVQRAPTGLMKQTATAAARSPTWRPTAVVLDLFGTLIPAPDCRERDRAVREIAAALRVPGPLAGQALEESWRARHDGTLRTTGEIADHGS